MSSAWSITAAVNPPRATFLDFPLGHTAGRPDRPDEQVEVLRDVLEVFATASRPGTIRRLPYAWGDDWRTALGRESGDTRTARAAAPVYQREDDREAACARHGETAACQACEPGNVPVD